MFHIIRRLREELKVNSTCGASNFSFGLPNRNGLNARSSPLLIGAGMTLGDHPIRYMRSDDGDHGRRRRHGP